MSKNTVNAQVAQILAKAKVEVVSQERIQTRGPNGHFNPAVTRMVIEGPGVKASINRNYFKKVRIPALNALGVQANLRRVRKNTNEVVLELIGA